MSCLKFQNQSPLYTLLQTLKDQENLDKLCKDRILKTKEIFKPNAYYGIDFIIKKYLSLPLEYQLKIIFPHGYRFGMSIWEPEFKSVIPMIAAYENEYKEVLIRYDKDNKFKKIIFLTAFPYLYLDYLLKDQVKPKRQGTIFFPQHSTHHVTLKTDFETIVDKLLKIEECYKPVTVCVYWRDYILGHHLPFQERGFKIVSAGHMYDPYFLFRFYHLCSMHRYSASNLIGSHLFYSVKAGCDYFQICDHLKIDLEGESKFLHTEIPSFEIMSQHPLNELFKKRNEGISEEKKKIVDFCMGTQYLQSPVEFLATIKYSEKIYKERAFERLLINASSFIKRVLRKV